MGRFSLVASAARQVKIDVRPSTLEKRIRPGSDQVVRAVVFGSRSLDVHDIDVDSLRLGSGEAESRHPGVRFTSPVNGDRHRDLSAYFDVRDAEIAYGDREICLAAETFDGELLEGCDRIETSPSPTGR